MKLYLVRHGECVSSALDPNQPLSDTGINETQYVGHLLKQFHITVDEIQHSVKLRAKQTAEILCDTLTAKCPLIQKEGLKPMDPVDSIIDEIQASDHPLMLVGHLPFMEKLLTSLLYGEERLSPVNFCGSCVVCLEKNSDHWQINWVISPKLI